MDPKDLLPFFKVWGFSHINAQIRAQLERKFPDCEVREIDVWSDIVRRSPGLLIKNLPSLVRIHGTGVLTSRKRLAGHFFQSPAALRMIRPLLARALRGEVTRIRCTFQTQSLFDARVQRLPHFVYTDHTHLANLYYPGFERKRLLPTVWTDAESEIYANATVNFTMSRHVARSMHEHYGIRPAQVACVGAGSNTGSSPPKTENEEFRNQNILFVGIDWERKGGPQLLEAFAGLRSRFPRARLTIVGASPRVELPGCQVLGKLPIAQVRTEYSRASIFCFPTRAEPFGIAPLEALIQGLPVVASRIGAMPDLIQDGQSGRLVDPDDIGALREALASLLSSPETCRLWGQRGREFVQANYTWDVVGDRIAGHIRVHWGEPRATA